MSLDTPLARGFTAEIYAWNNGQVVKLFNSGIARETVEYEANLTRIVHGTGLPVPAVGDVCEINGRFGLELECVDGSSMLQALVSKPWNFAVLARQLAELQVEMHTCVVPGLPSQHEKLMRKIDRTEKLPEKVRQEALRALELLPEDNKLCHGDFHPGNILLSSHGPVIIDWIDATRGFPLADVARSTLLLGGGPIPPGIRRVGLIRIIRRWFYATYLRCYFQLNPTDHQQLSQWVPVVAAARLDENIRMDEDRLLSIAKTLVQTD
jgi:uncharacterized protein (TIGR02172 family)